MMCSVSISSSRNLCSGLQITCTMRLSLLRSLVFQAGLVGLPPFLGELAEQARSLGAALLVVTVLSWIGSLGEKSQGVNRLVLGLGELKSRRLGRAETHLFYDAVTLVAERPATAATWRDDQIKVVATRIFAGANGKIVFCGDHRLFGFELYGGFELPPLARGLRFRCKGDSNSDRGTVKGRSGGGWPTTAGDLH